MKNSTARVLEQHEPVQTQADIFDLSHARMAKQTPRHTRLNGDDYEDFLAHYGNGVASDFA